MKKKTNNILAVILIILGIVMLFPIYILFTVSFRNEKTVFVEMCISDRSKILMKAVEFDISEIE